MLSERTSFKVLFLACCLQICAEKVFASSGVPLPVLAELYQRSRMHAEVAPVSGSETLVKDTNIAHEKLRGGTNIAGYNNYNKLFSSLACNLTDNLTSPPWWSQGNMSSEWQAKAEAQGEVVRKMKEEMKANPVGRSEVNVFSVMTSRLQAAHTKEQLDAEVAMLKELKAKADVSLCSLSNLLTFFFRPSCFYSPSSQFVSPPLFLLYRVCCSLTPALTGSHERSGGSRHQGEVSAR